LTIAIEAKRNCRRVTDCGKEAWSATAGRRTETESKALPIRASEHEIAKLSWSRIRRRKFGGRAVKGRRLIWGDLALRLKGRRDERSKKSAEAIVSARGGEGLTRKKSTGSDASQRHTASDVRATGTPIGRQG
jgi:hypothetical protein